MLGFDNGYITIFKGDQSLYEDWFKSSNARYSTMFQWYIVSTEEVPEDLPNGLEPVRLDATEIFVGETQDLLPEATRKYNIEKLLYGDNTSDYFGEVNTRYDLVLRCTFVKSTDGVYGSQNFHVFEDKDGNIFTWNTNARLLEVGKIYSCRGTVKAHEIYKTRRQTVLSRVMNFKERGEF